MTPEEKRQKRYERFGISLIVLLSCVGVSEISYIIIKGIKESKEETKQSVIDNQTKQYEKTLPYYKEYLQTKEQIAQYRDSLQQVIK